jgi:D-lactate dehydrogenase
MPAAANKSLPHTDSQKATAVYFPSCLTRTMGRLPGEGETTVAEALVTLAARAGMPVWIPPQVEGHCCSTPFSSKGYREAHTLMVNKTVTALWEWTEQGRLPVVIDTSICTHGLKVCRPYLTAENARHFDRLVLLDSVEFAADQLLPRLTILRKESCTTFHAVCSLTEMELNSKFEKILRACSEKVLTPPSMGCCAFAGDRGWLHPELTASATTEEAREVAAFGAEGHYSSSRTCEVGMTRATGEIYRSYLYLLEWATR